MLAQPVAPGGAGTRGTMWTVPGFQWQIGGAFVIAVIAVLVGVACYLYCRFTRPAFFRKQTLTRATPTLTPDK